MIGGACVLVRLYQTWAGHQGNENPVAIDEIKRIQWLAMMRQLASLRDIILEGGQNRHELPRLFIPRMRQNLLDLNHVLNMFANWETCMTNYEWIFQQVQRLATIRGLFAWEVRHEALLCLEDCHYSGYKPAKQFLVDLEERARAVQVRWQNAGWPAAPTHVYTEYRAGACQRGHVLLQCHAALLAGDYVWAELSPPEVRWPRRFFQNVLPPHRRMSHLIRVNVFLIRVNLFLMFLAQTCNPGVEVC